MQLMSIGDLAAYLGDSKRTIYKYIAGGDCPPYIRISAKNIKFDRADVDAWLESKKIHPGPGGKKMNDTNLVNRTTAALRNAIGLDRLPWTPRAQAALRAAKKHARDDGFAVAGTEHLLLGMLSVKDCLGAVVLEHLGVTPAEYQHRYEQLCQPSGQRAKEKTRLSDDIDKVTQCAYEQAGQWGHTYIGAEHLLAGILLAGQGAGFQILTDLGVTLNKVREETAKQIVCTPAPAE
jgi:excisionase family DNA binding protein